LRFESVWVKKSSILNVNALATISECIMAAELCSSKIIHFLLVPDNKG